jgi:hypothetical protein
MRARDTVPSTYACSLFAQFCSKLKEDKEEVALPLQGKSGLRRKVQNYHG